MSKMEIYQSVKSKEGNSCYLPTNKLQQIIIPRIIESIFNAPTTARKQTLFSVPFSDSVTLIKCINFLTKII